MVRPLLIALLSMFITYSLSASDLHVPDPYEFIQDAIDAAVNGDRVIVADGTYTGDRNKNLDFNNKTITVRSENGPSNCTIDCEGSGRAFIFQNGEPDNAIVRGFTITNGYVTGGHPDGSGGGILCINASAPTIINCSFVANSAGCGGGGMRNYTSSPTVINCTFIGNTGGTSGGGGMHNGGNSSPAVINCRFVFNESFDVSGGGGGVRNETDSSPILINCTFSKNFTEGSHAGGMGSNGGGTPIVQNCIFWDNNPVEIEDHPNTPADTVVMYSCIRDGWSGEGWNNMDADPLFVDPGYWDDNGTPNDPNDDFWVEGDYRLQPGSPCIDAGFNNALPADTDDIDDDSVTCERLPIDLDGSPRFADDLDTDDTGCGLPVVADMGGYEFAGIPMDVVYGDVDANGTVDIDDVFAVLAGWGECDDCCLGDVNADAAVDIDDIFAVLANWGPCP